MVNVRKPQRDLALSLAAFAVWALANIVFWNVARDRGWLPYWLALTLCTVCFALGAVGLQLFVRRWRRQFAETSSPSGA
jgi:hypothetical protein